MMITTALKASEEDHINWLWNRIQEETDYSGFSALVQELNKALERKDGQSKGIICDPEKCLKPIPALIT